MEENEELAILMRGLRGQNLRDSQFAEDDVQLRLVEVRVWLIAVTSSLFDIAHQMNKSKIIIPYLWFSFLDRLRKAASFCLWCMIQLAYLHIGVSGRVLLQHGLFN